MWENLWYRRHWPKTNLFLWILFWNKNLTCYKIQCYGFYGLSTYSRSLSNFKSSNHVFNNSGYIAFLLGSISIIFHQYDHNPISITSTLHSEEPLPLQTSSSIKLGTASHVSSYITLGKRNNFKKQNYLFSRSLENYSQQPKEINSLALLGW